MSTLHRLTRDKQLVEFSTAGLFNLSFGVVTLSKFGLNVGNMKLNKKMKYMYNYTHNFTYGFFYTVCAKKFKTLTIVGKIYSYIKIWCCYFQHFF